MTLLGVPLVFEKWFKQTLCFRYFTETISRSFGNIPVNKIRQCVFAIILGLLRDPYMTNQWKSDTMGYIIHWLDHGYICYWTSDLSRHYVLATLLSLFWANLVMYQWIK